jgi:GNAT superfamily N-acetyltransferase
MGGRVESKLRAFEPSDLEAVRQLIHAAIDASYTDVYPPRAVQFFKDYHTADRILERHAKGDVVLVEREAELLGTGAIVGDHIVAVFVHPEHQRHGIGTSVMEDLERAARAAGHHSVHLDVSLPSRPFYESRGYTHLESCSIDVGVGERLDYWTAEKSLGGGEFQQGVRADSQK